ncbi:MAG: hypothetical protein RL398_1552 [Planctomycetota bacterium]
MNPTDPPVGPGPAAGPIVVAELLLQRLKRLAESLLVKNSLDDLLWEVTTKVGELFGYEDCVIYLVESVGLVQYAAFGVKNPSQRQIKNRIVLPIGQGIVGAVAETGRAELVSDTERDPRYIADEFRGRSELAVPIVYSARVIGVLDSESSQRNGFTKADVATFELLATLVAPRIASALAERDLSVAIDDLARAESSHRDRVASMQRQRLESLGQLAGGIAHDFNNLLTAILGNVTLAKDLVPPGVAAGLLAEAQESCGKARELSRQLVAFSAGGAPMLQPGDPFELLRELVDRQFGDGRVAVRWLLPDQLPVVAFDRGQLGDALRHLLRNAAEAMPGGGALEISARVLVGKDRVVEIAITDSGAGVPSPLRGTIFDPYFTTKEGASGLGLSTAFWILRRHGGSLELDPAPTAGARFVVTLPVMAEVRRSGDGERGHRLRVLVLDDDIAVRRVLVRMLESLGHRVASAGDGEGCVREFAAGMAQGGFDVVMLDLTLRHGISWDETFAGLRQLDPGCVVMAMSGYHDSPVMANCRLHGFSGALSKPFTGQDLDRALAEAVAVGPVAAPR